MAETWGSVYYEIHAQIKSLRPSDLPSISTSYPANNRDGDILVSSLDHFLHKRHPAETLVSLSPAEQASLQEIYNNKVMELTGGHLDDTVNGVSYSLANHANNAKLD